MSLGDLVTRVGKTPIRKVEDLLCAIEELEIGGAVDLTIRRQVEVQTHPTFFPPCLWCVPRVQGTGPEETISARLGGQPRSSL